MGSQAHPELFKRQLDRIVERERKAHQDDFSPIGGCIIEAPGYPSFHYTDITPKAARAAAAEVGANYRFKFAGRVA